MWKCTQSGDIIFNLLSFQNKEYKIVDKVSKQVYFKSIYLIFIKHTTSISNPIWNLKVLFVYRKFTARKQFTMSQW